MVEQTLTDVGIANSPEMPTRETCGAWLMLRMEVIALQEAKKRLQNRALGEAGNPEGRGKRAHKGKVIHTAPFIALYMSAKFLTECENMR